MELSLPVLVAGDQRDRFEVVFPGISMQTFSGPSLAALLDDAALHLMENLPKTSAEQMPKYELCPEVELRKIKVKVRLPAPEGARRREEIFWTGRVSVVLTRWPEDEFWVGVLPRFGTDKIAVHSPNQLETAAARFLEAWVKDASATALDARVVRSHERLEILNFDADLPSILPSRRPPPKKKKKKRTAAEREKEKAEKKKIKRELVAPVELRSVATNLTHRALDGRLGRAHLRDQLAEEVTRQLDHEGTGILLVGPSGAGKTALVHEVVRRLAGASRGLSLKERRDVWQVDGNRLIAGMSMVGAWENRVRALVQELTLRQDILYVADLPALVYTGRSAHADTNVANFLEPHLARGELRIIGECTAERLLATRDEAPGFFARFRIVQLEPLDEHDALIVLVRMLRDLSSRELLSVDPGALEAVLALTRRFEANQVHPGKSVSLLSRVLSDHSTVERDALGRRVIDRDQVISTFGRQSGLPSFVLTEAASRPHSKIREFFEHRIVAQPAAVDAASDVVTLLEQALNDPSRPISTFLFVGPTGVGKTETAKAIAELLFGSADRMIRFDMSELLHTDSVARLFGDRRQPEGELTRRVQQQPFSVILLDEIEKAHPSVFDALLQVLGEGRLTNAAGRTVDFTSTVIIMTSNLGVRDANKRLGFDTGTPQALDAHYRSAAEKFFRPELFNRIDRVIAFSSLGREAIAPLVARLMEAMLGRRGLRRSSVVVEVDPALVELIIDQGFDPRYGARSIKRVLEQKLAVPLAQHLIGRRGTELTIARLSARGDQIAIAIEKPEPPSGPRLPPLEPIHDQATLERRYRAVKTSFEAVAGGDVLFAVRSEFSSLLDQPGLDPDRLELLNEIVDRVVRQREALESFEHDHLEALDFEEDYVKDEVKDWDFDKTKTLFAPAARAVREVRGPLRRETAFALEDFEYDISALRYRIDTVLAPPTPPIILRFSAIAPNTRTLGWLKELGTSFDAWLRTWAAIERANEGPEEAQVQTMTIDGPGVGALVRTALGYWVFSEELGPDLLTSIIRVEEVGAAPDNTLRYWFEGDRARDVETGIELHTKAIAQGLALAALRRVFTALEAGEP